MRGQNVMKKTKTEARRSEVLRILQEKNEPITGSELALICNVSRQIIVGDITILKAKNEPIVATPSGYIYLKPNRGTSETVTRVIASQHPPERAEEELLLLVDCGVTVKDVKVEHPLYGDLVASIMVSNRREVQLFIQNLLNTKASLLSQLTDGIHLHTLEAKSEEQMQKAIQTLKDHGFIRE